jgi:hypothetical protein
VANVVNRGTSAQGFYFQGSPGTIGFSIQYLSEQTDVTDAVVAGTFTLPSLEPGDQASMVIVIIPTKDAGVGATVECEVKAFSGGTASDFGEIEITRTK